MSGVLLWVVCPKENATSFLSFKANNEPTRGLNCCCRLNITGGVSASSGGVAYQSRTSEEKVYEVVLKQAALVKEQGRDRALHLKPVEIDGLTNWVLLHEAYDRCGAVCAEYAKTFHLGTLSLSLSP